MTADQFFEALGWVVAILVIGWNVELRIKLSDKRDARRRAERAARYDR